MRTSRVLTISLPSKIAIAVDRKSRQSGLGRSELLRAAFLRYLRDEENELAFQNELQKRARSMGVRSEDSVEVLIDSMRA